MQSLISLRQDFDHRYTANQDHLYLKDKKRTNICHTVLLMSLSTNGKHQILQR